MAERLGVTPDKVLRMERKAMQAFGAHVKAPKPIRLGGHYF
jgi:hypothetical protein